MIGLITGGSASGKSEYAERMAAALGGTLIYVAAMHNDGTKETKERIERHLMQRQRYGFITMEQETDIDRILPPQDSVVLVECLSNLLANEMFLAGYDGRLAAERIVQGIQTLSKKCRNLLLVTNEVFSDGCEYDEDTRRYIQALADINCALGKKADCVVEVVYSIPVFLKGRWQ